MKRQKEKKRRYAFSLKDLVRFYTRFPIPWWMYIVSVVLGFAAGELAIQLAKFTISFNKGELYNHVIIGYALLTILNSVVGALRSVFDDYASLRVTYRARQAVWKKILHLPQSEVDRRQPSALISGVTNDVGTASTLMGMLFGIFASFYSFARALVELFRCQATLAAYMLVTIPLAVLVFTVVGRLQHEMQRRTYASLRSMTEFFSEHISAAKNIKTQAMEDQEEAAGLAAIDKRFRADLYEAIMGQLQVSLFSFYNSLGTVMIALFGSSMIRKGQMEQTGINDFTTYMNNVNQYLAENLTHYQTLRGTQGALQYVGEMLEGPQEEPDQGEAAPEQVGDLQLEHVTFGYDPAQPVLRDLTVTIPAGKVTAVIGNNGSGKSTLLKLLQGVYYPDGGTIRMGGADVSRIAPHALRRQFGYILQNNLLFSGSVRDNIIYGVQGEKGEGFAWSTPEPPLLFEGTVRENIEYGDVDDKRPPDAVEQNMRWAAQLADADGFIASLAEGYDTDVGESGKLLSGGQRQRVAIARTLMTDPRYLLMDEAGASLDHKSDDTIFRSVRQALKGRTIVVVAHDMRSVVEADHIIVLDHGTLEAQGTHAELLKTSPTYRGYLEKQGYALAGEEAAR